MKKAIVGKKLGMTQIFLPDGRLVPVTVIQAGPCTVVQKKTLEKDGYEAVQFGFDKIPENIKEELHIICVLFTEEVGGVFTIGFTPLGEVEMDAQKEEGDLLYDDIGAELLQKEIRRKKADMLKALSIYFKVTFLHQDAAALLEEEDDE